MSDDSSVFSSDGGSTSRGEFLSSPNIPSTAAAAREVDEEELERALNAVVHDSLPPLLVGLSVLYLVQMFTHMVLLKQPNAAYISLTAAGSSVVLLLLRMVLTGIEPRSEKVYAVGVVAVIIALGNTLWSQALTEGVQVVVMGLLLVGTGFVFLSTKWYVGVLCVSLLSWLGVSALTHPPSSLFFPTINLSGTAALATMMHVVRRRTNRRAERLRRATEVQQKALSQALMVEEHHRRSLAESEESLEEALTDLQKTKQALVDRERRLSRMVDELTVAKEQAEEASQLKSAMLANMSHEVRTPLTSITGFAEIMAEEATGQAEHFASLIHENSQRLLETLGSVLRLSKLEAGKKGVQYERFDLVEEVEALSTEQSERAREAGVDLQVDLSCDRCPCTLDRGAVQRILRNLVGNAIKFTDAGGEVVVRLDRVEQAPENAAFTHACLEVEDTGAGMSEDFQEDMFEAFRQEGQSPHSGHEGSGLGLSITKQLVDLMEGTIEVESEKGVGTCFTIYLPRRPGGVGEEEGDGEMDEPLDHEGAPPDEASSGRRVGEEAA
jgi:signal transduction histidine kinase